MAGKNPLGKFRSKPVATSLLSFRFNPAEEDLIEEYSCDTESTYSLQSMTSYVTTNEPARAQSSSNPASLVSLDLENSTDKSESTISKEDESTAKSEESASPIHVTANPSKESSRDVSPSKESIIDYFSKVGKRSSSLDYGLTAEQERWSLSGIKGKIVRRIEEFSKDAQGHWSERKKLKESTSNGLPNTPDDGTKVFSHRSQSSSDVRSQAEDVGRSPSVEEGIDCAADDSQVPYSYHLSKSFTEGECEGTVESSQSVRKSSASSTGFGTQTQLRNRTRQHSGPGEYTFSLSSLKATNSFDSDILSNENGEDNWEFVEKQSSVEEEPEEVMLCDTVEASAGQKGFISSSSPHLMSQISEDSENRTSGMKVLNRVKKIWQHPLCRTRVLYLGLTFLVFQLAPIGTYLTGFLTGCLFSFIAVYGIWSLFKEPLPKEPLIFPDYDSQPPLKIPPEDHTHKTSIYKGWMNELLLDYNPETYHVNSTMSVYIRLDGTNLRLSRPKMNLPRRAMWNELKHNPVFIHQRFFNIQNASVMLIPEGLARKRFWSKKYPICVSIPDSQSSQLKLKEDSNESSPVEDGEGQIVLYLFARTCREKEEWFRRFTDAATSLSAATAFGDVAPNYLPRLGYDLPSPLLEDCFDLTAPSNPPIDYKTYMMSYLSSNDEKLSDVPWLNALIGRIFFDFLTQKSWSQLVAEKIQRKLSVIKVPYFMEELKLRDINLGDCMPQVQRASDAVLDARGLWMDFDLTYRSTFQMTLETKLNLMKLRKKQHSSASDKNVQMVSAVANDDLGDDRNRSYLYNSDEEDSAESSTDEDNSQADADTTTDDSSSQPSSPVASRSSTGKKVLHWVDKIAQSRYFQQATENRYIRKAMTGFSNTPLILTVEVHGLVGTLALNIPPPPSDRLWYGFRGNPQLSITARPKLGEHEVTITHITDWIEKKLSLEFQKLLVMPNMDDLPIPIMDPGLPMPRKNS